MDTAKQVRYLELRQQLSELNCPNSFGVESCDCVEFLVKNIVSTTNSYKLSQDKESRLAADLALAQAQLFPLRKENARLARESHQLHEENIKCREENANFQAEQSSIRKKLEDRVNELIYLCKSKDTLLAKVEADRTRIKEAFESMVASPSSKTQSSIKVSKPLPVTPSKSIRDAEQYQRGHSPRGEPADGDILQTLRTKLADANENIAHLNAENMKLTNALKLRDHELNRDARLIDSNRGFLDEEAAVFGISSGMMMGSALPGSSSSSGSSSKMHQMITTDAANRTLIDQLNSQVDFLNEQLAKRESQLVEMGNKLLATDYLQTENTQKTVLLDKLRVENNSLSQRAHVMEQQVKELQDALDPDGSVSVEEFINMLEKKPTHSTTQPHHSAHPAVATARHTLHVHVPVTHVTKQNARKLPRDSTANNVSMTDDVSEVSSVSAMHKESKYSPLATMRRSGIPSTQRPNTVGKHSITGPRSETVASQKGHNDDAAAKVGHTNPARVVAASSGTGSVSKLSAERDQLQHEVTRLTAEVANLQADRSDPSITVTESNRDPTPLERIDYESPRNTRTMKSSLEVSRPIKIASSPDAGSTPSEALLRERLRRSEDKLTSLQAKCTEYQRQAELLAHNLADRDYALSTLENENKRIQMALSDSKSKLSMESHVTGDAEVRFAAMLAQQQLVVSERDTLQSVVNGLRSELNDARKSRADAVQNLEESILKFQRLEKYADGRRESIDAMLKDLTEMKQQNVKLRLEVDKLEDEVSSERRKNESVSKSLQESETSLQSVRSELNAAAQQLVQLKSTQAYLQSSVGDDNKWKSQVDGWKTRTENAEKLAKSLQKDNAHLSASIQILTAASSSQGTVVSLVEEERKRFRDDLTRKDEEIGNLHLEIQQMGLELDRANATIAIHRDTLSASRATNDSNSVQISKLTSDLLQSESEIKLLQKRLADATSAYSESRGFATDSSKAVSAITERCSRAEEEVARLTDIVSTLGRDKATLEDELRDNRRSNDTVSRRVAVDKDDIRRYQLDLQEAEGRVSELKVLVAHMESSNKTLMERNTRLTAALRESDEATQKLEIVVAQMKDTIQEKDRTLAEHTAKLISIEDERDRAMEAHDNDQLISDQRSRRGQQLEQQSSQLRGIVERLESRLQDASAELATSQHQCMNLDKRVAALREENLELKKSLGMKAAELRGASEDLMLMTKENQAVTAELAEIVAERDRLHLRLQQVAQSFADLEQVKRGLEIEKSDLLQAYKIVIQEKRQLEADIQNMGNLRQKASLSVQQLQERLAELTGQANAHAMSESRWTVERASMSNQIEELNEELVKVHKNMESIVADNRRLIQESHSLRQSNGMLTERMQLVIKRAASATDANKVLSTRLSAVERERDAVRAMIIVERQKSSDMSQIVESARSQIATKDTMLNRYMQSTLDSQASLSSSRGDSSQLTAAPTSAAKSTASPNLEPRRSPGESTPGATRTTGSVSYRDRTPATATATGSAITKKDDSPASDQLSASLGISYEDDTFDDDDDDDDNLNDEQ